MSARGLKDDKSTVLICIRSCLKYKWPWKVGRFWVVNKYLSISQLFYGISLIITQFLKFINVNFVVFRRLTTVNRGWAWSFGGQKWYKKRVKNYSLINAHRTHEKCKPAKIVEALQAAGCPCLATKVELIFSFVCFKV